MARLKFTPAAEADLSRLDKPVARLVFKRLAWLAENTASIAPIPLKGEFRDFNKFRIGNYRAIYTVDSSREVLIVHFVRHRREVYKFK